MRSQWKSSVPKTLEHFDNLDPSLTFDAFVEGTGNKFALAAAKTVAKNPGTQSNPLSIYGDSGLGKTHLLNAIGNQIISRNPKTRVLFISTDTFLTKLISAIRDDDLLHFRQTLREEIDVLLLEEFHFLAGKPRTQEELVELFNSLHGAQKQIIISSLYNPLNIEDIESRLATSLQSGLVAEIQPP